MITTYLRFDRKRIRLVFFYLLLFSTCLCFLYCLLSHHFLGQLLQHSRQSCRRRFLKPRWTTNKLTSSWVLKTAVIGAHLATYRQGLIVTDRPHVLEDPAVQALRERAHKIAEDGKAQQIEERAEDDDIVGRLVSATMSSEFRTATGAPPRQYTICRWQKSCD